jgi:hypothetical protein
MDRDLHHPIPSVVIIRICPLIRHPCPEPKIRDRV